MPTLSVVILAAGKGTRMKSKLPKVLHPVARRPMIDWVLDLTAKLKASAVAMVVGHGAGQVKSHVKARSPRSQFFLQKSLNGSGGALRTTTNWIRRRKGVVLVTCGDMPLLRSETLKELISEHKKSKNAATVLTAKVDNPFGYGRIVRGDEGEVLGIVEHLDASSEERAINEINTGTYCFDSALLARFLPKLKNNNAKKEFYLTDILSMAHENGHRVGASICEFSEDALGVNRRRDLAIAEERLRRRKLDDLMDQGVTILDPNTTYIDDQVKVGADTVIWPQTFILGASQVGSGCEIGPWAHISDTKIQNRVTFKATFSESALIKSGSKIGPFSRIRPGSVLGENAHLGNFSEVKKSSLGPGSKVNHLSYLGDAKVGKNVNIGAGTITCNYDGFKKHPTVIQDHAFIGSNVNLIAPIRVGSGSVVGAGSSLSQNVPPDSLALERAERRTIKGWVKKRLKKGKKK